MPSCDSLARIEHVRRLWLRLGLPRLRRARRRIREGPTSGPPGARVGFCGQETQGMRGMNRFGIPFKSESKQREHIKQKVLHTHTQVTSICTSICNTRRRKCKPHPPTNYPESHILKVFKQLCSRASPHLPSLRDLH